MTVERPCGQLRGAAPTQRAERARLAGDAPARADALEVHVPVGPRAARVRGRPELAQQAQLDQPGLELGAGLPPVDGRQRAERSLHRGPLPRAREVRPQARAEAARPPDVERLSVPVAEHVDPRPGRGPGGERALRVQPPRPGRGQVDQVGDGARAALLRQADQAHEDLGRGRASGRARWQGCVGTPKKCGQPGEPDAADAALQEPPRQPDGVDHRRRDPPPGDPLDLAVEEPEVEARVVGDEHVVAGEPQEPAHRHLGARRATELGRAGSR